MTHQAKSKRSINFAMVQSTANKVSCISHTNKEKTEKIKFELLVAKAYTNKARHAQSDGIEFALTMNQFRLLYRAKRCQLTGVPLTYTRDGDKLPPSAMTVDRIDNRKCYVSGNVMAVCHAANNIKSTLESPDFLLEVDDIIRMGTRLNKLKKQGKFLP